MAVHSDARFVLLAEAAKVDRVERDHVRPLLRFDESYRAKRILRESLAGGLQTGESRPRDNQRPYSRLILPG